MSEASSSSTLPSPASGEGLVSQPGERLLLRAHALIDQHLLPIILVAIEGVADLALDAAALGAGEVAMLVQPIIRAQRVDHLAEIYGAIFERHAGELDACR